MSFLGGQTNVEYQQDHSLKVLLRSISRNVISNLIKPNPHSEGWNCSNCGRGKIVRKTVFTGGILDKMLVQDLPNC